MHHEDEDDYLSDDDDNENVDFGRGESFFTNQFALEIIMLSLVPIPGYD